jgi:hypothetical protein
MSFTVDKNFAFLYGSLLGDGCLSLVYAKKQFVTLTCSLADDIPFFERVISPILISLRNKNTNYKIKNKYGAIEFNFIDSKLFDFILSLGFPIGKKGDKLFIPKIFYDKSLVPVVLNGYFATDGSFVLTDNNGTLYPRVEANGIAKSLLLEIFHYLNENNIKCKLYERKMLKTTGYNVQKQCRLQINGYEQVNLFKKIIGFGNPKHEERYQEYLRKRDMALGRIELPTPAL